MIINENDIFDANLIIESAGEDLMSVDYFASKKQCKKSIQIN